MWYNGHDLALRVAGRLIDIEKAYVAVISRRTSKGLFKKRGGAFQPRSGFQLEFAPLSLTWLVNASWIRLIDEYCWDPSN